MTNLHSGLRDLLNRHLPSKNREAQDILMGLQHLLAQESPDSGYQYRHPMGWDSTWMDLDESQLEHVLKHGHVVERRRVMGGWEPYTGGRQTPEPEFGMFPIDHMAPRPETPHAERIFAASKDLYDAWARGESWAVETPLHRAYALFFLETINDAIGALNQRWKDNGMVGEFPDSLAVQDELKRITCLEDRHSQEAAAAGKGGEP